jgi:hypothetical protein
MILYLIKMIACSAVFWLLYRLLLEKEKMHRFNRWYLLVTLCLSFIIPLLQFSVAADSGLADLSGENMITYISPVAALQQTETVITPIVTGTPIQATSILYGCYALITALLLFRLLRNIIRLRFLKHRYGTTRYQGVQLVLLSDDHSSFTFLDTIYISNTDYTGNNREILLHELSHVRQRHSWDILFIETLLTICWFNPLFYLYKKAMQLNHEFLADEAVIHHCADIATYQHLLLDRISLISNLSLSIPFNYSVTKKRLLMMTHYTSPAARLLLKTGSFCLLAGAIVLFSKKSISQQTTPPPASAQAPAKKDMKKRAPMVFGYAPSTKEGVSKEWMDEYTSLTQKYVSKNAKGIELMGEPGSQDRKRMQEIYFKMSPEQQLSVRAVFWKRLGPLKKEIPTSGQLEKWKNPDLYGVWIDDKKVDNSVLGQYKAEDFSHFFASKLYPNAKKGKRYDVQLNLMTNAYYEDYRKKTLAKPEYTLAFRTQPGKNFFNNVN